MMAAPTGASSSPEVRHRGAGHWLVFFGIAAGVVVLDQLSKAWVVGHFGLASPFLAAGSEGGPTEVLGNLVRVASSHNDGGIFGLLGASAGVLGLVSIGVIGIIIWLQAHQGRTSPLLTVALGLLLGGALGNLIDRLSRGFVVDWVDVGIGDRRFYTFNVADSAISIAVVILLVLGLFGDRLGRWAGAPSGTPGPADTPGAAGAPGANGPGGASGTGSGR
jgi:signal peptidase II